MDERLMEKFSFFTHSLDWRDLSFKRISHNNLKKINKSTRNSKMFCKWILKIKAHDNLSSKDLPSSGTV